MELQSETVFCVKCAHYRHNGKGHICAESKTTRLDLVTGEYHEENLIDCNIHRKDKCGEGGVLFKLTDKK